jgi:molecular chaperone DnaJ
MAKRDYYEILGIQKNSREQEIKKAYRQMALKYHPDRNPDNKEAEELFKEASEAYSVLIDKDKRAMYDMYGHSGVGNHSGGFSYTDFDSDIFSDFADIFGSFFGGDLFGSSRRSNRGKRRQGPIRGNDLQYVLHINLEDAIFGKETTITIPRLDSCTTCSGTGRSPDSQVLKCTACNGTGQIRYNQGFLTIARTCSQCNGAGQIMQNPCMQCHGYGRIEAERSIKAKIPAGVDSGTRLRLRNEGEAGIYGGEPGDLYVLLNVKEHPRYKRHENDLYVEKEISFLQAILGDIITVETLYGEEKIKIEEGTQPNTLIAIKGKGVPYLNSNEKGDLYIKLSVKIPTHLTSTEKELLMQIAKSRKEDLKPQSKSVFKKVKDIF